MKKLIAFVTIPALVLGIGSALAFKEFSNPSSDSNALAKTFNSTEEIAKDANVIIKANVPSEFKQETVGSLVYNVYEVQVDKLYSNLTDEDITEGESIEVHRLIGFNVSEGKEMANIGDSAFHELKEGEYLLFLNGGYDEDLKKFTYIPNTPNQLFKMASSKGFWSNKSSNSSEFENITDENALPSINETDLLEAIESMK
ncbi:hypothetical protein BRE01_67460 [Brevibacillus reuszeri]|uniref:Uncharacterized protein n=1 Tax=Brevibacillus reuszeri TaxID=54915 RepID=A0A0K9YNA3_9BACL|nr:hypothetical protein [Brevibacillus reuszeri]KNB70194.1 hypothetical protein ADS79_14590 [Brevibacillus reuszeri]GED73044.1 hypothetical protein BRE01_67460 [Brevibacillus reuszeri]